MEKEFYGFIYMTTNLVNNKKYIGMHKGSLHDNYLGSGKLLIRSIKKYGKENFSREILDFAYSKEQLSQLEKYYIKKFNAINNKDFYNIHEGGYGGNTTMGYSYERKLQYKINMSKVLSNSPNMKKHIKKLSKMNINRKRNPYSKETINKLREMNMGEKNPNYGNYWSEEKKQQLSELRIKNGKSKGELNGMFGKKGDNAINGKKVYMYNEDFKLLKTFNTVGLVLDYLNLKGHSQLNKAIKNKTLYKGFYWSKELI